MGRAGDGTASPSRYPAPGLDLEPVDRAAVRRPRAALDDVSGVVHAFVPHDEDYADKAGNDPCK